MYANNPDLVNSNDSNYVITSVLGHNQYLGANQWGYSMTGDSGTFNEIPGSSYNAVVLADVTNKAKGVCDRVSYCGIPITFGANIEPKKSASGYYSTTLTYTVTSKPALYVPPTPTPPAPAPYVPPEPPKPKWTTNGCAKYGHGKSNCTILLPTTILSDYSIRRHNSIIYDYEQGLWVLGSSSTTFNYNLAYVPRFAKSGYYIRFCKDSYSSGCTDSEVDPAFTGGKLGKWISLKDYGCKNVDEAWGCVGGWWEPEYGAARILAEVFGSPCPK